MDKLRWYVLTLLLTSLGGSASAFTLTGQIHELFTPIPIAGAEITVGGQSVLSDAAGFYTVSNLDPGNHTVNVQREGYYGVNGQQITIVDQDIVFNFGLTRIETFGYGWTDSDRPDGPTYAWIDITDNGANLTPEFDTAASVTIDLTNDIFPFFDGVYTELNVQQTGALTATSVPGLGPGQVIPHDIPGSIDNSLIAGYWTDSEIHLFNDAEAWVKHEPVNDQPATIISMINIPVNGGQETATYQYILFENGDILLQY